MERGRPTKYSDEIIELLCEKIATSSHGLKKICDSDDRFPAFRTVFTWLSNPNYQDFKHKYARAREAQAELLADEIIHIADTPQEGVKKKQTINGIEIITGDMIDHRRLQVDARKWKASKLYPKKYGERVEVENSGEMKFVITTRKKQPSEGAE